MDTHSELAQRYMTPKRIHTHVLREKLRHATMLEMSDGSRTPVLDMHKWGVLSVAGEDRLRVSLVMVATDA